MSTFGDVSPESVSRQPARVGHHQHRAGRHAEARRQRWQPARQAGAMSASLQTRPQARFCRNARVSRPMPPAPRAGRQSVETSSRSAARQAGAPAPSPRHIGGGQHGSVVDPVAHHHHARPSACQAFTRASFSAGVALPPGQAAHWAGHALDGGQRIARQQPAPCNPGPAAQPPPPAHQGAGVRSARAEQGLTRPTRQLRTWRPSHARQRRRPAGEPRRQPSRIARPPGPKPACSRTSPGV